MINIHRALRDNRLIKATIGLGAKEFNQLTDSFEREFRRDKRARYERELQKGNRQRKPGGGRIGRLRTSESKLFFILFYFKCYPTLDLLGLLFDLDRSNALRNIRRSTPILEKTLGEKQVLPRRRIGTMEELLVIFPEAKEIFIDGTERPIQRPKGKERQKGNYSGKKKMHTRKNLIISDKNRQIGYLGPTTEGKQQDYSMFKEEFSPDIFPGDKAPWVDLGFTGIKKACPDATVVMPKKKPKGKELTAVEKERNKVISGFRMLVEHAIDGVKRFRITTDKFRTKGNAFNDRVMLLTCGLWNYHLRCG